MSSPARLEDLARDEHLCAVCGQWCGRRCEREWNPRFLAYCAVVHDDAPPDEVLETMRATAGAYRMTPFIVWCRGQVSAWRAETRNYHGPLDHRAFDEWLVRRVNDARVERARKARP